MSSTYHSPLFALDIGTRSVVGLLLRENNGKFELVESIVKEHAERSMIDGQIHDVPAVAAVINEVKKELEKAHGPLKRVCVAAAGRALKTKQAEYKINIETKQMLTRDDLLHMELSAVQQAQFALANEPDETDNYYCVGYSVLTYLLDGEPIGSLVDQSGKWASVQVIATFLPKVVVESLLSALGRADLELEALTLEPIAAINVLIPPSMRRLNIALVDIGAGTSDIALTDENTVTAYGMVAIAGDEMTEALSDQFLLDFPEAERIKRELQEKEVVEMVDILGIETSHSSADVIKQLKPNVLHLARSISEEILSLNGQAPKAVMLVGGGSLTPTLSTALAECLDLPSNRIAIRDATAIKRLQLKEGKSYGPELVTPIGIAIAARENPIEYISISVNERMLRLFDIKKLTVGDGLLAAGINIAKLYGKPGMAIIVTVEGQLVTIPGEHGHPPILLKNGQVTSLGAKIKPHDVLIAQRGKSGHQAMITIHDIIGDLPHLSVTLNHEQVHLSPIILRNNEEVDVNTQVVDRDVISISQPNTVRDLLEHQAISLQLFEPFQVIANGETWIIPDLVSHVQINGKEATLDHLIEQNDQIELNYKEVNLTLKQLLEHQEIKTEQSISVHYNGKPISLHKPLVNVKRDGKRLDLADFIRSRETLSINVLKEEPFILQDIFTVIELDLTSGKEFRLTRNERSIGFSTPIFNGDRIQLSLH